MRQAGAGRGASNYLLPITVSISNAYEMQLFWEKLILFAEGSIDLRLRFSVQINQITQNTGFSAELILN